MTIQLLMDRISNLPIETTQREEILKMCTSLQKELEQLHSTTQTDVLGDWPNRRGLFNRAQRIFSEYDRDIYSCVSVAFIDLDKFKPINDVYGHKQGDDVLVEIASIIESSIRKTDVYGRLAGDEFVIILPGSTKEIADTILKRIKEKFCNTIFSFNTKNIPLSLTFGVVSTETGEKDFESLLHKADELMNTLKGDRSR